MSAVTRKSDDWEYFDEKDDDNMHCKVCGIKLAYRNASLMFNHMHLRTRKNQWRQTTGSLASHYLLTLLAHVVVMILERRRLAW